MKYAAAILSLFVLPLAEASQTVPAPLAIAVEQLRTAAGLWNVTTTEYGDDGKVTGVVTGTYRFEWVVPDRVLAGRSDVPGLKQSSGILLYVNESRSILEMATVGADGQLWVMTGPAVGDTRTTPDTRLSDGRTMKLRFARSNVTADRFESRTEMSLDGGANWKPRNYQVFNRATTGGGGSSVGLRYRRRTQPYVPLT